MVVCDHNDHLTVSSILMNNKTNQMSFGLSLSSLPIKEVNFTERSTDFEQIVWEEDEESEDVMAVSGSSSREEGTENDQENPKPAGDDSGSEKVKFGIGHDDVQIGFAPKSTVSELTMALIHFISLR